MLFRRSYFSIIIIIIIDKTRNKSPSKIMFKATVSAATVVNRIFGQVINKEGEKSAIFFINRVRNRAAHPHQIFLGEPPSPPGAGSEEKKRKI